MSSAVPKIVIRARPSSTRNATASSAAPTPDAEVEAESEREEDVEDEGEVDDENAMDVDPEENATDDNDNAHAEGVVESLADTPAPRKRGRPPGSKKVIVGGISTPRARGRGRGRPRTRGRGSFMIRLPKRGDDDTEAEAEIEGENEGDVEGGIGTPVEGDAEVEKEVPVGRGKPFRNIQGTVYVIDGDEFITDDDPKGDEKIDKFGNLLGGRRFKASTFILPNRHPQRQYMLAIDAARTSGFRDSLYYFRRNLLALKLNATQPEKEYLIAEGKLGSHLRTRSVTLVTARSAFKLHGSKTILDGKWVTDDYYEDRALAEVTGRGLKAGDPVGDLPDPNAPHHNNELSSLNAAANAASNKADRGGGGGGLYRAGGPTTIFGGSGWGPFSDGPLNAVRKSLLSRDGVAEDNWMWMMATRVNEANESWAKQRREAVKSVESLFGTGPVVSATQPEPVVKPLPREEEEEEEGGVNLAEDALKPPPKKRKVEFEKNSPILGAYEPHTNIIQYRSDTQPTSYRWEALSDSAEKRRVLGGTKTGNGAWALAWVDTVMEFPDPEVLEKQSAASQARERLLQEVARSGEGELVDMS